MKNRLLAGVLALVMALGLLPMGALAAGLVRDDARPAAPLGEEAVSIAPAGAEKAALSEGEESVNLALNGAVYASGAEHPLARAVDGDQSTHWGGSSMKNGGGQATAENAVSWFVVDLRKSGDTELDPVASITDISMKFNALVWPTSCKVQAAADSAVDFSSYTTPSGTAMKHTADYANTQNAIDSAAWTDIATLTKDSGTDQDITLTVDSADLAKVPENVRYIRVYFTGINTNAGGTCIGMKELTVMGTRGAASTPPEEVEPAPTAVNVVEDPGFENTDPVYNGYFSTGRWDKNGEATARSTEQAHSGTYSLKFNNLCGTKQVISNDRLQAGTYTLSLWMYQDATAETTIRVHTGKYAANGPVLAEKARITSGANSSRWVQYSLDFEYKSGDPMIEIYNEGTSGSPGYGVAYIDDVSVTLKAAAETPDPVVPTEPGEGQHYAYLSIDNEKWGLSTQPYTWTTTSSLGVNSTLQGLTVYRIESNNPTRGALMKGPGDITDGTYVILAGGSYTADKRDCNAFSYSADTGKTSAYHVGTKGLATNILYSVNTAYEVRLTQNTATGGWTIRPVVDNTKYLSLGAGKQDTFEELPFGAQEDAAEFVFLSADEANADSAEAYKTGYMNIAAIVNDAPTPVDPPVPGEGQQYAYLGFEGPLVDGVYNRKWGIGTDSYALRLFKVPNVTTARGDEVLDGVKEGSIYYISAPSSLMRQENDSTIDKNTISNGLPPYSTYINPQGFNAETANMYRFHATADGCWTIENVGNGKYLNIGEDQLDVFNQLPFGEEASATQFVIAPCQGMGADNAMHDGFFTIAAIVDAAEVDPPAPERTLEEALADESTEVHFLTMTASGGGWTSVTEQANVSLQLYALSDPAAAVNSTSAVTPAAAVESGASYAIRSKAHDGDGWSMMHCGTAWAHTNQCGSENAPTALGGCAAAHLFVFTRQSDGTYTIQSESAGNKYLTQTPTDPKPVLPNASGTARDEFDLTADASAAAKFGVTAATAGSYYIWWETQNQVVEPDLYTPEQAVEDGKTVKYLAFTGGVSDNRGWDVSGTAGNTAKIQLYSAAGTETSSAITLDTDGIEAGNYVINFDTGNNTRQAVMHYSAPATNQCSGSTTTVYDTLHLFTFAAAEGNDWDNAFTIAPNGVAKYLSLEASGNNRLFKDEKTTFYVNPVEGEQGKYYLWIAEEPEDYSGLESAQTAFSGTTQGEPFSAENVGTQVFRIPAMITLDNGWIVASADVRWAGWSDSPANLDTIVSVSKDNGATWEWEVLNYRADYVNTKTDAGSANFIDSALLQAPDGKVWMAVDANPSYVGNMGGNHKGSESTGFDSQGRMVVAYVPGRVGDYAPTEASAYTYYVDLNDGGSYHTICANDGTATEYSVDAFLNLYKGADHAPVWVKQEGAEKKVQSNLFYRQSAWRAYPTFFIMLRNATVNTEEGTLDWGDPVYLSSARFEDQTHPFLGVCPGRGAVTEDGRIIFPLYDDAVNGEKASVIYSDDNGATWHRGQRTPISFGNKTSESQIITLPDGTLRMYCRTGGSNRQASYTDSTDGGVTWSATQADAGLLLGSNCMYSIINVNGVLEGPNGQRYEHVVMASYPEGNGGASDWGNRSNGSLRLGYISGSAGNWTVNWLGEPKLYHGEAGTYFAYSCLTQFGEEDEIVDKFAAIYEPNDNTNARPNIPVDILYKEFDVAYVLGEGWTLTVEGGEPTPTTYTVTFTGESVTESTVTVAANGTVGSRMPAAPTRTGYTFAGWKTTDGAAFTADTVVTANVTVVAQWTPNEEPPTPGETHTVTIGDKTFKVNHGATLGDQMPEPLTAPDGYTFGGWLVQETGKPFTANTKVTRDMTVIPVWTMKVCVVTIGAETFTVPYGETLGDQMPADPVRAGYTFAGWQTADGEAFTADTVVTEDVSVGARWTVTPPPPSSGGGSSRPAPSEEDLNDPDVPLANGPLSFEDVRLADWFYADVAAVFGAGVMKGVSETRFEPGWRLNRGMMAQVIYNLEKDPAATAANPFADVTDGNYYQEAVAWGAANGVFKGYDDGRFGGEDQVTREQMVLMLYRYSAKKDLDLTADADALAKFTDQAKVSDWAAEAVRWAVAKGLLQGRDGDQLDPGAAMTRAEVAAILARYVKLLDK